MNNKISVQDFKVMFNIGDNNVEIINCTLLLLVTSVIITHDINNVDRGWWFSELYVVIPRYTKQNTSSTLLHFHTLQIYIQ